MRRLISEAYASDGDLQTARGRLSSIGERDIAGLVTVQADGAFLRTDPLEIVCALSNLAEDLGGSPLAADVMCSGVAQVDGDTPETQATPTFEGIPTITPTPSQPTTPTITPTPFIPTLTPTAILLPDTGFDLTGRSGLCGNSRRTGLLQVFVFDADDHRLPGVEVVVEWEGGSDRFYTGLKPGIDPGYAEFQMEAGRNYTLTLTGLADPVVGLLTDLCEADDGYFVAPTIQLVFEPAEKIEEATPES